MRSILLLACVVAMAGFGLSPTAVSGAPVLISPPNPLLEGDPRVPRPAVAPCVVTLFNDVVLDDTNSWARSFSYTPPAGCLGPWAKVVLEATYRFDPDFGFDDTLHGVWVNGLNLHFGGRPISQSPDVPGRFDRDVTDYAAALRRAGTGRVLIDDTIARLHISTAVTRATARLLFYPANATVRSPRKPDVVLPIGLQQNQMEVLRSGINTMSSSVTLPRDVEQAYLDVLTFSAPNWVWWSCVPSADENLPFIFRAPPLEKRVGDCGGGTFYEAQVSIDGVPAGVAPIAPWISSITLFGFRTHPWPPHAHNLIPYRVDLSPFAGRLSDGAPHVIGVSFIGGETEPDRVTFNAAATLLVYRDPHSTQVSGAVTRNTLAGQAAVPTVVDTLRNDGENTGGHVSTTLRRQFVIEGYIDTARGRIRNRVVQTVYFNTEQTIDNFRNAGGGRYQQELWFNSKVWRSSWATLGATQLRYDNEAYSFPLYAFVRDAYVLVGQTPMAQFTALMRMAEHQTGVHDRRGVARFTREMHARYDGVNGSLPPDYTEVASFGTRSWDYRDNRGSCYSVDVTASQDLAGLLYDAGTRCPNGRNVLWRYAHPDGSPDSLGWAGWQ